MIIRAVSVADPSKLQGVVGAALLEYAPEPRFVVVEERDDCVPDRFRECLYSAASMPHRQMRWPRSASA